MPDTPVRSSRVVREINRREIMFSAARLPGTSRLLVACSDGKVYDLDAGQATPTARALEGHTTTYVTGVKLAGRTPVSCAYDGRLIWWDLERGRPSRTVEAHDRWIRGLTVSPDGSKIA